MKKMLLAVIVMATAGGALYYFLQNKKHSSENNFQKDLIIGKWKIDSLEIKNDSAKSDIGLLLFAMDSVERQKVYEVRNDGYIYASLPYDSLSKKDTSSFSWGKSNEFLFKESVTDSLPESFKVVKLDKSDFVLQSKDSVLIYLKKI
jgi:hypothetical protein